MTCLENYMLDGANWQARAVMCILQGNSFRIANEAKDILKDKEVALTLQRYHSSREDGYVLTLSVDFREVRSWAFFEHSVSDRLMVFRMQSSVPTFENVYPNGKDRYSWDAAFSNGEVEKCAEWILSDIIRECRLLSLNHMEMSEDEE